MNGREFQEVIDFESHLTIGSKVKVTWTNSHRYFSAPAEVTKINAKSFVVTLTEEIRGYWLKADDVLYPIGQKISVPRLENFKLWSVNNRVEPA
jgi:hypothetical protein